ncbi:putative NADH dehydrogenase [ubiquinone] 1 alpha subcomplex subunit 5 [Aphelenchoides bicaudatus]|nr:putative NADH dehydrogenase [ubiquinone] 1 alpha subcomplex subunit 5 [Aphelenchoides bicaudatus]
MASFVPLRVLKGVVRRSVIVPACSMHENPYIERHKAKRIVSEGFKKKTTGLTGLFVNEHPHHTLSVVYGRILRALQEVPADYVYRKHTEELVKHRLALVEQEPDIEKLEEKIGMGLLEEVIEQAEFELDALRSIIENRAWEPLVGKPDANQWRWPIV